MDSIDSSEMRTINSNIVLKILWTKREISRSDIARITGMSRSTISAIINDIMELGLLSELGSTGAKNGRRPVTLQFKDQTYSILGLDIGRERMHLIVSDLRGNELSRQTLICDLILDRAKASEWIFEAIRQEQDIAGKQARPLIGIGLAIPVPIALAKSGRDSDLNLLPGWDIFAFREAIHRKFQLPVLMENDMKLGALAELRWGRGKSGSANIAVIKLGQPPKAGLIIDGKIHQGAHGFAGQIANVILRPDSMESAEAGVGTLRTWSNHMNDPATLPASREEQCFLLASSLSNMLALLDLDEVVFIMDFSKRIIQFYRSDLDQDTSILFSPSIWKMINGDI
ncbi:MAG: ROK family transcriptional regulator [Proteobacteria bacterium]|nr:MAG: ROK family transcriptional regulator [Pseudomonadota bacterium]